MASGQGAFGLICSEPPAAPAGVTRFVRVSRIVLVCALVFDEFNDAAAIM